MEMVEPDTDLVIAPFSKPIPKIAGRSGSMTADVVPDAPLPEPIWTSARRNVSISATSACPDDTSSSRFK